MSRDKLPLLMGRKVTPRERADELGSIRHITLFVLGALSGLGCHNDQEYKGPKIDRQDVTVSFESEKADPKSHLNQIIQGIEKWSTLGLHTPQIVAEPNDADIRIKELAGDSCGKSPTGSNVVGFAAETKDEKIFVQLCPDSIGVGDPNNLKSVTSHEFGHAFKLAHLPSSCDINDISHDEQLSLDSDSEALRKKGICGDGIMKPHGRLPDVVTDVDAAAFHFLVDDPNGGHLYQLNSLAQPRGVECATDTVSFLSPPSSPSPYIDFKGIADEHGSSNAAKSLIKHKEMTPYVMENPLTSAIVVKPIDPQNPSSASISIKNFPPNVSCQPAWCSVDPKGTLDRCLNNCTGETIIPDADGNCTLNENVKGNAIVVQWHGDSPPVYSHQICEFDSLESPISMVKIRVEGHVVAKFGDNPKEIFHTTGGTQNLLPNMQAVTQRRNFGEVVRVDGLVPGMQCHVGFCDATTGADTMESDCLQSCTGATLPLYPIELEPLNGVNGFGCALSSNAPIGSTITVGWKQ